MPKSYPSDMTDQEWEIIRSLIPAAKRGGRHRSVNIRKVVDAIFYVTRGGIQWAMLPKDFPPMSTVYWYFAQWKRDGTIEKIHDKLRKIVRITENKKPEPTAGSIDSQSSKTTEEARSIKGFDAGKKIKGRKRHIIVDTLGLLLTVLVHSAGIQDTNGAKQVVQKLTMKHIKLKKLFADGGYNERFIDWAKVTHDLEIEVVKRNEQHKFVVLPKR